MISENLKGGDIMNETNTDIVYVDYRTSSIPLVSVDGSSKPDSLVNIIKNRSFICDNSVPQSNRILLTK